MFHCAAVRVSQLWGELQSGELVEGPIFGGVGGIDAGSFGHVLSVLCPGDLYRSRVETSHITDQGVLLSELFVVSGVDDRTGGRICREARVQDNETYTVGSYCITQYHLHGNSTDNLSACMALGSVNAGLTKLDLCPLTD